MTRLAVSGTKLIPQSPRTIILLSLLFLASFVSACNSSPKNTATDSSSPTATAPASSSSGSGNFEGAITAKLFAGAQPMELKYAIKGTRSRIETQLAQGSLATGVMLLDWSSGSQFMLIPQTKTYMSVNLAGADNKAQELADSLSKELGQAPSNSFKATATGKSETIAGHTCQHWLMGDKQDTDVCLANGLGFFGGGQSGSIFEKLKTLGLGDKAKAQLAANPEFAKFVEGGAFPLKISQLENGQSKTILEVTSVERKPLDDSLFSVPADYKKMDIPGMPGTK